MPKMPPEWLGVLQDHGWTFNDGKAYEFLTNRLGPAAASARSWVMSREEGILLLAVDNHCDNKPRWSHPDLTPKVWERAKATIYDGVPSLALSPEDEFLFLCWHIVTEWLNPSRLDDLRIILSHPERPKLGIHQSARQGYWDSWHGRVHM